MVPSKININVFFLFLLMLVLPVTADEIDDAIINDLDFFVNMELLDEKEAFEALAKNKSYAANEGALSQQKDLEENLKEYPQDQNFDEEFPFGDSEEEGE